MDKKRGSEWRAKVSFEIRKSRWTISRRFYQPRNLNRGEAHLSRLVNRTGSSRHRGVCEIRTRSRTDPVSESNLSLMFRRSPRHRCDYIQDELVKVRRDKHSSSRLEKEGGAILGELTETCTGTQVLKRQGNRKNPGRKVGILVLRGRERESLISNRSKFPTSRSRILVTEITDPLVEANGGFTTGFAFKSNPGIDGCFRANNAAVLRLRVDRFDAKFVVDDQRCS